MYYHKQTSMGKLIISFLLAIWLSWTVIFYLSNYDIFNIEQKKEAISQSKNSTQTPSFVEWLWELVHKSAQVVTQAKNNLPTIEETKKRMERERQEEINRIAIELGMSTEEVESMFGWLYPATEDYGKMMQPIQQESQKMIAEMNKNIEKSKTQVPSQWNTRQQYKENKVQWTTSYINVNWKLIAESELTKNKVLDTFAECLSIKWVKMYWAIWCHHCNEQKKLFGNAFDKVRFIDCDKEKQHCLDAWVRWFPTWITQHGNQYPGTQNLKKLSEISWCPINN